MTDRQLLIGMGRRIAQRRRSLGLTQEQVAEQMNVSVQMISNLEQGRKAIRPENLARISAILGVSTDYLLLGSKDTGSAALSAKLSALPPEQQSAIGQIVDLFLSQAQ